MAREPLSLSTCTQLAGAASAALLVLKGAISGCTLTDVLLLVPFFFSMVPVVSYSLGEGLYAWNRDSGRFELYDLDEHPIASKAGFVFFIAASAAFAFFMFKLAPR